MNIGLERSFLNVYYLNTFFPIAKEIFDIDGKSGQIKVIGSLDREYIEKCLLVVVAEDLNAEKLDNNKKHLDGRHNIENNARQITSTTITILVDDVNDNAPVFRKRFYTSSVRENSDIGTIITTIIADDLDKNRTIKYR